MSNSPRSSLQEALGSFVVRETGRPLGGPFGPLGPVVDGLGVNMTVMSYMGTVHFGLVACRETVPRLWEMARGIDDALDELLKATAGT